MKLGMDTKYLKTVLAYFLTAVCAVVLVFYFFYHLFNGFTADIETQTALLASENDILAAEGYLLRDETVIRANYGGAVDYAIADGERVGVGAVLANVYAASDDDGIRHRVIAIDEEIALLEASNIGEGVVISDTASTDEKIDDLLYTIRDNLTAGHFDYARRETDSLLIQLNKREIITGQVQNYNSRIAALTAERAALTAQLSGSSQQIKSTQAGYFFYGVDGYERIFTPANLDSMTLADFDAMRSASPAAVSDETVGKLFGSYVWYVAVPVEKVELDAFTEGSVYSLTFPYNFNVTLSMTLERTVTEISRNDALLIFSCSTMPEDFSYLRVQSMEITIRVRKGLRVPAEAVRVIDGETGVYILRGGIVEFRRVSVLFERDGDCIVDAALTAGDGETPYLALYDEVITAGKDLYVGKVLK